jgi:protein-tyrosine kinase
MISLVDSKSTNAEDFRSLAVSIELLCKEKHIRTLLLTNVGTVGDKEAVAANLAIAYAQQGKRILLLDANLKSPRLHSIFGIENQKGILDTFSENADIKGICQSPKDIVGLSVITSGLTASDSTVWLDPDKLVQLLVKLHKLADLVIVNGPSAEVADAQILASKTDGVLLIAELGVTQVESALAARKRFQLIKAEMIGVVLNKPARPRSFKKISLPHDSLSRKDESSSETKYLPSSL